MLGRPSATSMAVWARTSRAGNFHVVYGTEADKLTERSEAAKTDVADDNTGFVTLTGLKPRTKYFYKVIAQGQSDGPGGYFHTLPAADAVRNAPHNPDGLFNFSFEVGSCANQNPAHGIGHSLPTYTTMLREVRDKADFAIMNGDWLYEEQREYAPAAWLQQVGLPEANKPRIVELAPTITGVWENYKTYLSRAKNLSEWHAHVPSFFTFDDHELLNDLWGSATAGLRDRRTVFRDIGTRAWYDYLGWANPVTFKQDAHFGRAEFKAGSDVLFDAQADFTALDFNDLSNLMAHWGTPTAGVDDIKLDSQPGDPNAGVYDVVGVIDKNRLRIRPAARAGGSQSYSIGRYSFFKYSVANSDIFFLDTRSQRDLHDTKQPAKSGISMIGKKQREWLMDEMKKSKADFFFIVSTVTMMIPHVGSGGYAKHDNKDEAWTVFLEERERMIDFWDGLGKPVIVLTGDLHNSFAIKVTDRVWEFAAGPHNSVNHTIPDEGDRPANGRFKWGPRACEIRWSSFVQPDIPRAERHFPFYVVAQVNNVFNNPLKRGDERWIAYPQPQVVVQFYDGYTGDLKYAEAIAGKKEAKR